MRAGAFVAAATLLGVAAPSAVGAPQGAPTYTCVDGKGSKRSSDRPIPECSDREQRVLNKDGSQRRVIPPTPAPPKPRASGPG
jgi:hypothetical protein